MPSVSAWPTRPSIALCDRAALWGARVNAVARSAIGIAVARTAVATRRPQGSLPSSATSPSAAIATASHASNVPTVDHTVPEPSAALVSRAAHAIATAA